MPAPTCPTPQLFARDLHFPECPRWHDGALWLSDMWDHTVYRFETDGGRTVVHRFSDEEDPGGLGWLPDGRPLVAGMLGRVVYRLENGSAVVHADLRDLAPHEVNDMIVGPDGTAYVTQFGVPMSAMATRVEPTTLLRVDPAGQVAIAAGSMLVPNGVAISADGETLVVAESAGGRLTQFHVSNGRLLDDGTIALTPVAAVGFAAPDGICLDERGGVWIADPLAKRVVHITDGVTDQEVLLDLIPLACVLGGADRRTLFICVNEVWAKHDRGSQPTGAVLTVRTNVPGAGSP